MGNELPALLQVDVTDVTGEVDGDSMRLDLQKAYPYRGPAIPTIYCGPRYHNADRVCVGVGAGIGIGVGVGARSVL